MNTADIARALTICVAIADEYRHGGDSTKIITLWNELNTIYAKGGGAAPTEAQIKDLLPKAIPPRDESLTPPAATTGYGVVTSGSLPSDAALKSAPHNFAIGDVKLTSVEAPARWMVIHRGDVIPTGFVSAGPIFDSAPPAPTAAAHPAA